MTKNTSNKKKVTLKPKQMKALINKAELGEEIEIFNEIVDVNRIKLNVNKCFVHYLNDKQNYKMANDEVEDILLLQQFLEKIQTNVQT